MGFVRQLARKALVRLVNVVSNVAPDDIMSQRFRSKLYGLLGARMGRNVTISGGTYVNGFGLEVGDRTFINRSVYFDLSAPVRIGRDIQIGHHVKFVTAEHSIGPSSCRAGPATSRSITVEDGAWIGAAAVILPGISIGAGSIVGAGAVVTRDVQSDMLVGGVPARTIRRL